MEPSRKKRCANFTPNETILLLSLVSDQKHIVENKKTDAVSMQEKQRAWEKISHMFNAACEESMHRTTESLKKLYDNKKRTVRKDKAEEKKSVLLTGGGPPKNTSYDPSHELVLSIVDPITVIGGNGLYGSDSLAFPHSSTNNNYFEYTFENDPVEEPIDNGNNDSFQEPNNRKINEKKNQNSNADQPKEANQIEGSNDRNNNDVTSGGTNIGRPLYRRRPAATVVRSLASNELAEKYRLLADKKKCNC